MEATSKLRALVIDDEQDLAERWAAELAQGAAAAGVDITAEPLYGDTLDEAIGWFADCQRALSRGSGWEESPPFGECDLMVVDADLRYADGALLATGQGVSYLARCFADVGALVLLNAYGENSFDLSLAGRPAAFAEVVVGAKQIPSPGLWRNAEPGEFRPWSWPLLQQCVASQRERQRSLHGNLDVAIVELLGLQTSEIEAIERSVASFLLDERGGQLTLEKLTVWDFVVCSQYGLARKDGAAVKRDSEQHARIVERVGAARLGHWVNRIVAPTQDLLADGPHVAAEFPSALPGGVDLDSLNSTPDLKIDPDTPAAAVCELLGLQGLEPLTKHAFWPSVWADRPLWWGRRLRTSDLLEAERPWEATRLRARFCEDESRFRDETETRPFACDLATPYRMRSVSKDAHDGVVYRPKENLIAANDAS